MALIDYEAEMKRLQDVVWDAAKSNKVLASILQAPVITPHDPLVHGHMVVYAGVGWIITVRPNDERPYIKILAYPGRGGPQRQEWLKDAVLRNVPNAIVLDGQAEGN